MIKNIVLCVSYERGFAYAENSGWIYSGNGRDTLVFVVNGLSDADRLCAIAAKINIGQDVNIISTEGVQKGYEKQINDYFRKM